MRSRFQEGMELLRLGREQLAPIAGEAPHPIWGRVMTYVFKEDILRFESPTEIRRRLETSLALAQKHENQKEIAFCLWCWAVVLKQCDNANGAIPYFEQSIIHYQKLGDRFYLGYLLKALGTAYFTLQQPDKAAALIKQSLELRRETGDLTGLVDSVGAMGWIAYNNGCYADAEAHWQERRQLLRQLRTPHTLATNQYEFAWLALFNYGDLDSTRLLAEEMRTIALNINNPGNSQRTLPLFGFLEGLHENYAACRQFFQEIDALNQPYFPFMMSMQQMGLCLAACGLNDLPAAHKHLRKVLEIGLLHQWPANVAKALTFAAIIAAKSGKPERATELLALVFHHPLSPKGWLVQWPLIARQRAELEATLTPERFQAVWQRAATLDLLATAKQQVAELFSPDSSEITHSAPPHD